MDITTILPEELRKRINSGVCIKCAKPFTDDNVFTNAGWRETRLSQMCEVCFDGLFEDEDD